MNLIIRATIDFPSTIASIRYLKGRNVHLANECPSMDDIDWTRDIQTSCQDWMFNDFARDNTLNQLKEAIESDYGWWPGTKDRPYLCDILKIEVFEPSTRRLLGEKEWSKKPRIIHVLGR